MIEKGDIYYIGNPIKETYGSEIQKDRPGVVISVNNETSNPPGVIVAFLTTKPKNFSDFHTTIHSSGRPATVLVEQMKYVTSERIGSYIGCLNEEEMDAVDECILKIHGIDINKHEKTIEELKNKLKTANEELKKNSVQLETYKEMFQDIYSVNK